MASEFRVGPWLIQPSLNTISQNGTTVRLEPKVLNVLVYLSERRGEVVPKEELIKAVWSDAFVTDDTLTRCIYELRKVLQDDVKNSKFIQTVPRRGYRLIPSPHEGDGQRSLAASNPPSGPVPTSSPVLTQHRRLQVIALAGALISISLSVALLVFQRIRSPLRMPERALTRLTFEPGLQTGATWSPDGRFIAYSSNQGGNFDIWVRQVDGGDPVRITHNAGQNWQPEWSPDGKYIAYRCEEGNGGLYIVPALGGLRRKIADSGYYPRWSPDSTHILFLPTSFGGIRSLYIASLDGEPPHTVLDKFFTEHANLTGRSAAWHPDNKRISIYVWDYQTSGPVFWTVSVQGGDAVRSEVNPALLKSFGDTTSFRFAADTKFSWEPNGTAIYFERTLGGAQNLWKMKVNSKTLQATSVERLTTGAGSDSGVSISADGRKLAFSGESRITQIWMAPFDARSGKLIGTGAPATSPGTQAWVPTLSPDGEQLAFSGNRGGVQQIWQKSLASAQETPITASDSYGRAYPVWSPDGHYLAYPRWSLSRPESSIVIWSRESHEERVIVDGGEYNLYGWMPNGQKLIMSKWNDRTQKAEIWLFPLGEAPPEKIAATPEYFLFQGQCSSDGRWIVFEAIRDVPSGRESTIYVVPATGGQWIRITNSKQWDDKPRWSPDGRTIYFVSGRGGFYNVWGVRFDSANGRAKGAPFRVTNFDSPAFMVPSFIPDVGLSIAAGRLAITTSQSSGGIWVLNNIDE